MSTVSAEVEACIKRLGRLKNQRANVRRSLTLHESLLLSADTKELGRELLAKLRNAEGVLTERIGWAANDLREAQRRQRLQSAGVAA